jgi:hypothetical protein
MSINIIRASLKSQKLLIFHFSRLQLFKAYSGVKLPPIPEKTAGHRATGRFPAFLTPSGQFGRLTASLRRALPSRFIATHFLNSTWLTHCALTPGPSPMNKL